RALGSLTTMAFVYAFTRRLDVTFFVGGLDALAKILLYFAHERTWNLLQWGRRPVEPAVLWFTGLSGSGKSTLAKGVYDALVEGGLRAEYLDGDELRRLFPDTGYSRAERDRHVRRAGHLAGMLEKNGVFVVVSLISPYAASRRAARALCRRFVEVHVSTPLAVCEKRDPKGLYARARRGELADFTGVQAPYEAPESCELVVDAGALSEKEALARVLGYLRARGVAAAS
ncbi:MAG TPA: adenylyl-sulfate kinase, partial [Elusimicrobiota bacterium]|nr:adenylyl-sulfate kinase [Elusimicrobiota bacterium]